MKQGRLNIGVLGYETAGVAIAQALQESGHLVIARTVGKSDLEEQLSALLPTAKIASEIEILESVELVILAIDSEEISEQVKAHASNNLFRPGQIIVHTAVEFGHQVLNPAAETGAITLAISPAMRFTGTSLDLARIKESYFAVSAPSTALPIAQALVIEMGAEPIVVLDENRSAFAEAIAVAGNFSAMIVNQATGLLEQAGVENPASVIAPVIRSAVEQALSRGHRQINPEDLIGEG